jgi:hypothetical protein
MTLSYPPDETLAACGSCGWVGVEEDLRHPDEYENETPLSYKGRNDELEGGREFCPCCDESAQVWSKGDWEANLFGTADGQTWDEFVQAMKS